MEIRSYLPSAQFTVLLLAVALSAGLVWGTQRFTNPPTYGSSVEISPLPADDSAWRDELLALGGSSTPPEVPGNVFSLVSAAQTGNLTESVGRSLLLSLSAAQAENRANDENAQLDILSSALAQTGSPSKQTYAQTDLKVVADSSASLRAYGNGVMEAVRDHEKASWGIVAQAVGLAVDNGDSSQAAVIKAAAEDYRALAKELAALSVPQSFAALHVHLLNNFSAEADACEDMASILTDPLRGLRGFQNYQALTADVVSVFTALRDGLSRSGILFTKDEPGYSWNLLKSSSQTL